MRSVSFLAVLEQGAGEAFVDRSSRHFIRALDCFVKLGNKCQLLRNLAGIVDPSFQQRIASTNK